MGKRRVVQPSTVLAGRQTTRQSFMMKEYTNVGFLYPSTLFEEYTTLGRRRLVQSSAIVSDRQTERQNFMIKSIRIGRLAAHLDVVRGVYTTLGRRRMAQSSTVFSERQTDRQTEYYDKKYTYM